MAGRRRFTLIGPGRAGLSIAAVLEELGWERRRTYGRRDDVSDAALDVELCIVATPDAVIEEVAATVEPADGVVMHLSGATPVTVVPHEQAAGLHPLVALVDPDSGARRLRSAWFGIGGHPIAEELAEAISGKWYRIADADRTLYHAAAVVASNHVVALLGQAERIGATVELPLAALLELARANVDDVIDRGPAAALTGPASRGDEATIERHLDALARAMPDEVEAYRALAAQARRLAGRDSRAD